MRYTSKRRKAPTAKRYEGDPGTPLPDRGVGPIAAKPGNPGLYCDECDLLIRPTDTGRMRAHALGGWGPSIAKGHPTCLGYERWVEANGKRTYKQGRNYNHPLAPWSYYTQSTAARLLDVEVLYLTGLANNPLPAVKVRGKTGRGLWLFQREAIDKVRRARGDL